MVLMRTRRRPRAAVARERVVRGRLVSVPRGRGIRRARIFRVRPEVHTALGSCWRSVGQKICVAALLLECGVGLVQLLHVARQILLCVQLLLLRFMIFIPTANIHLRIVHGTGSAASREVVQTAVVVRRVVAQGTPGVGGEGLALPSLPLVLVRDERLRHGVLNNVAHGLQDHAVQVLLPDTTRRVLSSPPSRTRSCQTAGVVGQRRRRSTRSPYQVGPKLRELPSLLGLNLAKHRLQLLHTGLALLLKMVLGRQPCSSRSAPNGGVVIERHTITRTGIAALVAHLLLHGFHL
mmetsp:Transcript_7957/g.19121  ORF Transcript_7957/g.19121 Transcript_7957/m.19121 type:complete len:293 (-) Transcript_7957:4173-5051(-)